MKSRFDKKINNREIIEKELPDVMLELILLLDAGLVTSAAIEELGSSDGRKGLINSLIVEADRIAKRDHLSFSAQLYSMSADYSSLELLRFSGLLYIHEKSGAALSEKLEIERDRIMHSNMTKLKIKAKEADTKLVFPMTLLLIVILLVSVAPALLQFNF